MLLSSIVLTKNEESLERCLKSLSFCDEIIVEDLSKTTITDFAYQRNKALEKAKNNWVLFVDSDEVIPENLKQEILSLDGSCDGYYIKRRDFAFGKWLRYGETANVKLLRLAKKNAGKWIRPVHEVWKITGKIGTLKNPLNHYSHQNILDSLKKINYYSDIEANFRQNEKSGFLQILLYPLGKFIKNFILLKGFLDGMPGFLIACLMSAHSFLLRVKIWEKNNNVAEKYL